MSFTYEYPRPALTVDVILVTQEDIPSVLLIQRKHNPFEGKWAFPGGFLDMDEDLKTAALRELEEETNVSNIKVTQFKTYGTIDRDPRGRTVSVVFYAFIKGKLKTNAGDDASKAEWFKLNEIPKLAFDHDLIMNEFCNEIMKV